MIEESQAIEKKKKYLKRYKKNLECIRRLENKLYRLDSRMTSIKSPTISDMPRGGTPVSTEELIADKIETEERIARLKIKSVTLRRNVYAEIDKLDDVRYAEVLESMFIDCLDLEATADVLGYNVRHVQRLYGEALRELVINNVG